MDPTKRKPPARDRRLSGDVVEVAGVDIPRIPPQPQPNQASRRRRGNFARNAVFEMFPYRHARAIDYGKFADRKPNQLPRCAPAATWWRP